MGIRSAQVSDMLLNNVRVPAENMIAKPGEGFKLAMKTLDGGRIGVAAQGLGIAKGAFEIALQYMKEREQFGKITGARKSLDKGRQVFAFAAGTKKLYDYVDHNPDVMAAPVDYTNDIRVLAQLDNFVSINNAIDMDLFGQVNAESAGLKHISGTGGQLDFVMGAYLSKGGKSFICMSSTVKGKDGTLKSRIVPTLTPGSIATDPRSCVQYIVTEYGLVNLKGLTTWERAEKIISIAHPDFREQLISDAEKAGIWRRTNKR